MGIWDVLLIIAIVVLVLGLGFYFFNKWASRRLADQQDAVQRSKQSVTIYIIDKKKGRITDANFPKAVMDQIPKWSRMMKVPLVKAKIGPQIMTLLCDKGVFNALPLKKSVSVELAGMYIVGMKNLKTKKEMADMRNKNKQGGEKSEESSAPVGLGVKLGNFFKR